MPRPMADIDPYKILQVDSEAEDEVIQAAYRRLARKYHPDLATTPDAASRMAAINAAWELIGEPAKRQAFDRKREVLKATPAPAAGPVRRAPRRAAVVGGAGALRPLGCRRRGSSSSGETVSGSAPQPETVSRDWTSGRSTQGSGYEESMHSADGFGAAGPPPGRPSGTVLNFGRYAGWSLGEVARTRPRVRRVARSRPDRPQLPPGDRRDPAQERPAGGRRRRRDRAPRAVPPRR